MTQAETEKRYDGICQLVYRHRIKAAIDMLAGFLRYSTQSEYFYQLDGISGNYRNLLKYTYEGYHDESRNAILNDLSAGLLNLADEVRELLLDKTLTHRRNEKFFLAREFGEDPDDIIKKLDELCFNREVKKVVEEAGAGIPRESIPETLFKFIWLTGKILGPQAALIRKISQSETFEWHEKCLVVSALTLSLLDRFDPEKIILLCEFIEGREPQVYERALVGLVLALLQYDDRIIFYTETVTRLKVLFSDETVVNHVEALLMQILMARETEKITREFEQEILPEMQKVMPKLEDKLQLGNLLEGDDMEDKNPGWKDILDESPGLFERIEKFTRMQMEGGDVFMSTFSLLKRFDFFTAMSNWLVPYYPSNPDVKPIPGDEEGLSPRLMETLDKAFYICNSDKYSFALNFGALPPQQRSMIITYFESELEQMKEMVNEEQVLDPNVTSNTTMTQYIQDLYRFFKLHPDKEEFRDIFSVKINFSKLYFYRVFIEREGYTERLAAFYFDKDHYPEAIQVYTYLAERGPLKGEYFEKIAYSYQKMNRWHKAIEFYKKADLFDANRLWVLRKLGFCYLKTKDWNNALRYFEDALNLQHDDLNIQSQVGQCYLNLNDFNKALQHYSKVLYFQPDNLKVLRPIAYCQFVTGKLDHAETSYREILEKSDSPTPFDLMNYGHVLLCLGKRKEALEYYLKSRSGKLLATEIFMETFEEDIPHLLENGIKQEDIPLLIDFLLFQGE
jgi:tetratricopeptide (TPR) repeat protein